MEYTPLVIGLILIFVIGRSMRKQTKQVEDSEFAQRTAQLDALDKAIEQRTIDSTVNLTNAEVRVLDIYKDSGIRIPIDIIEELHHMNFKNEEVIFAYIENQRYYWKLENTKKPYKKGGE